MSGSFDRKIAAKTSFERSRASPTRENNSVRRAYDLLRFSLAEARPNGRLVEGELVDALSASRTTVRAVLQRLADDGLVTRKTKTGTTVAEVVAMPMHELRSADDPLQAGGACTEVLEVKILHATPLLCERLQLDGPKPVLMIEGLQLSAGRPLGLSVSYIALPDGVVDVAAIGVDTADPVVVLERQLQIPVGDSITTLGATLADAQTAGLLQINEGAPLVWLEDLLCDVSGSPVALRQFKFPGDRVTFWCQALRK